MGWRDPDWLDVTRKGNDAIGNKGHRGVGRIFAPSMKLLGPYLAKRYRDELTEADWAAYVREYETEMRRSYRTWAADWKAVLGWQRVVLVCFCPDAERCHRTVLAGILGRCGATVGGELRSPEQLRLGV